MRVKLSEPEKQKRKEERAKFKTTLKPGDILYTCWGYEQTNTEFFQVIAVKNNTVKLREIAGKVTQNGFMSGRTVPVPFAFLEGKPEITRRAGPGYKGQDTVKIDSVRYAWRADQASYSISWYG